mmetsp:Transcript_18407/g.31923  ORF Transcript_18407/g.31923 Transcript_18407/m.31923 type:complete len:96 (+) Transcript_18407:777-1064(+)
MQEAEEHLHAASYIRRHEEEAKGAGAAGSRGAQSTRQVIIKQNVTNINVYVYIWEEMYMLMSMRMAVTISRTRAAIMTAEWMRCALSALDILLPF